MAGSGHGAVLAARKDVEAASKGGREGGKEEREKEGEKGAGDWGLGGGDWEGAFGSFLSSGDFC